ncbi:flagellar hook-length control protein FliK [Shewanella sp.]|uniref:flagellar hook-length control protein FliK n=1 Tax=Shewanella sp. TaxID=50422 RepID=UPI00356721B2
MQQILNVLLGSPDKSQGAARTASAEVDFNGASDGVSFQSIISKTNAYDEAGQDAEKLVSHTKNAVVDESTSKSIDLPEQEFGGDDLQDVSSVFAQIQFSRQFPASSDIGIDGEILPPGSGGTDVLQGDMEIVDMLPFLDELKQLALSKQDGLSESEMFAMFTGLIDKAEPEMLAQVSELLGMDPQALSSLDQQSFSKLLHDAPELKIALDILALSGAVMSSVSDKAALAAQSHANVSSAVVAGSPKADGLVQRLAVLIDAMNKAPTAVPKLDKAVLALAGEFAPTSDADLSLPDNLASTHQDGTKVSLVSGASDLAGAEKMKVLVPANEVADTELAAKYTLHAKDAKDVLSKPASVALQMAVPENTNPQKPLTSVVTANMVSGNAEATALPADALTEVSDAQLADSIKDLGSVAVQKQPASVTVEAPTASGIELRHSQPQRGEVMQVQLSLRHGAERQVTTADMVARFAPVMNAQLIAMVKDGVQQAEIRLDPPELGAMMVRIQVQGSEAQVQFHVSAQQTKDVVEQALPRLRELLAHQGMELTDGQVSHEKRGGGQSGSERSDEQHFAAMDEIPAEELQLSVNQTTSYASGIDYYA